LLPSFLPPVPESPLPQEHEYKLQIRCLNCLSESYPVVCLGMKRLSPAEVRRRVFECVERLEIPCRQCEGMSSALISFFPAKPKRGLDG